MRSRLFEVMLAQAHGQAALRVCVYQKNLFSSASESDAEVQSGRCLADAALLVDDGNNFCVFHVGLGFLSYDSCL